MAYVQKLDLRQSQTLVMTPQLQQAIKLLQMSNLEITDFVAQEMEQNPLLEEARPADLESAPKSDSDGAQDRIGDSSGDGGAVAADEQAHRIDSGAMADGAVETADGIETPDRDPSQSFGAASGGGRGSDGELFDLEDRLAQAPSLRDYLSQQLNAAFEDAQSRLIAAALIDAVEPSGYLSDGDATIRSIAETLGGTFAEVESVLFRVQQFDPPGIMARNLGECLAAQLKDRNRYDPAMAALCANLPLLANHRLAELTKICGVDSADLADMVRELRALNPKPGEKFDASPLQTVTPDILMRAAPSGGWIIELNAETLPQVLVNRRYYAEINKSCRSAKEREYLSERLGAASWLVRSLDQRAQTILKVATEIVRQQDEFFLHGVSRLRPLVLRNIAEIIGMHESTVSRVTSNKYMATPRGVFELKYFFSSAIQSADGEGTHAAESIRHRLKTLIDTENPAEVLSDDTIVEKLQGEGIDIARRTVAKYREQLGIPSSVQRRRQKSFATAGSR